MGIRFRTFLPHLRLTNDRAAKHTMLNPQTYMQTHTPTMTQGGWWNLPWVFARIQYFEKILPLIGLIDSLWCVREDEVNNGVVALLGACDVIQNSGKQRGKLINVHARHVEYVLTTQFVAFCRDRTLLSTKKVKARTFIQKSLDFISRNHSNWFPSNFAVSKGYANSRQMLVKNVLPKLK